MKKIIGIIFVSLMFCNIGFAEIKLIEKEKDIGGLVIQVFCVDGYKFVSTERSIFTTKGITNGISTVQFYEGPDLPARC
tara:strand:- start:235 stop:471 length:237 start_codon:yes stop_codon:yes gene_type:complete